MQRSLLLALTLVTFCGLSTIAVAQDRILWRFAMDSAISGWEVSVGPDGTIYASDVTKLYALNPDGSIKWTTTTVRDNTPIDFLPDGTLLTKLENVIYALNPDGSTLWTFVSPGNGPRSQIEVGPSVGPDGNIYAASGIDGESGLGIFSLTPHGDFRWNDPGQPPMAPINGSTGGPVFFTQERLIFPFAITEGGRVYGFDFNGDQTLYVDFTCLGIPRTDPLNRLLLASACGIEAMEQDGNQIYWRVQFGAVNLPPAIGADATAYSAQWFGDVNAINPDGTIKWTSSTATDAQKMIGVRQDVGRLIYVGGGFGRQDFVSGVDTEDGTLIWTTDMQRVGGLNEHVWTQRAPTSADGSVIYFTTRFASNGAPGALYALGITENVTGLEPGPESSPVLAQPLSVFPNPSPGGRLSIDFQSPGEATDIDLAIYNVAGRRLRTLYRGTSPQAPRRVAWDGQDDRGRRVAPGSYFARLVGRNGISEMRRITVIR
jgi:outer membrane protein assembly factor BamB